MEYGSRQAWDELARGLTERYLPTPKSLPAPRNCGRVACEPGWSWRPAMADYDLWFALSGRGWATVNNDRYPIRGGTLFCFRPGDNGEFNHDPDDPLTVIYCHYDFIDPATMRSLVVPDSMLPARHVRVSNIATLSEHLQRVLRLLRDPHPLRRVEARAAFLSAVIEVYMQDAREHGFGVPHMDPRLQEVVDLIRFQPRRRPSLEEAAAAAGLSPSHLSRLFTRQLGVSFRSFVLRARLERAHHLLSETSMTVAEVAIALGYRDVFLFSRQFRGWFGQPPSRIRRPDAQTD